MNRYKDLIPSQILGKAVSDWEESVEWIAQGWDCIEEYTNDLTCREGLDEILADFPELLSPELESRIAAADQRFRDITFEIDYCAWIPGIFNVKPNEYDKVKHWYYFRWPNDAVGEV